MPRETCDAGCKQDEENKEEEEDGEEYQEDANGEDIHRDFKPISLSWERLFCPI